MDYKEPGPAASVPVQQDPRGWTWENAGVPAQRDPQFVWRMPYGADCKGYFLGPATPNSDNQYRGQARMP